MAEGIQREDDRKVLRESITAIEQKIQQLSEALAGEQKTLALQRRLLEYAEESSPDVGDSKE